jgi:hypothetical protein
MSPRYSLNIFVPLLSVSVNPLEIGHTYAHSTIGARFISKVAGLLVPEALLKGGHIYLTSALWRQDSTIAHQWNTFNSRQVTLSLKAVLQAVVKRLLRSLHVVISQ